MKKRTTEEMREYQRRRRARLRGVTPEEQGDVTPDKTKPVDTVDMSTPIVEVDLKVISIDEDEPF